MGYRNAGRFVVRAAGASVLVCTFGFLGAAVVVADQVKRSAGSVIPALEAAEEQIYAFWEEMDR